MSLSLSASFIVIFGCIRLFLAWKVKESIHQPESHVFVQVDCWGKVNISSITQSFWIGFYSKNKLNLLLIQYHLQTISHVLYNLVSNALLYQNICLCGCCLQNGLVGRKRGYIPSKQSLNQLFSNPLRLISFL